MMKRLASITSLLCLFILAVSSAAVAEPTSVLPAEIREFFHKAAFNGMTVLSNVNGIELGGREACYVVIICTADNENVLYLFNRNQNGTAWEYSFSTSSAVPQTSHEITTTMNMSGNEWPTGEYFQTPHLSILQLDAENEYPELCVTFELSHGKWLLHRIWSYTVYQSMFIRDGSISYYRDIESDQIIGTAKGDFQRDLRYIRLSAIPKTLAEARAKLTVAPDLPESNELQAYPVTFPGNQKYDVYSAPDKTSLRGAHGKAKVSTNSWIQVFGTENDWALIQYAIDASHYRFGYMSSKALPKKANIPALSFHAVDVWTTTAVSLTDDPLYSGSELLFLQEGLRVTWLATLGDWAYVEVNSGDWARGFIPLSSITTSQEIDMKNHPSESGEIVYDGVATLFHDNRIEFALHIAHSGPLAGQKVSQIRVTDTFSEDVLTILSPDSYGTYYGHCSLGGDITSITLTAVDETGNAYPPMVRIEW